MGNTSFRHRFVNQLADEMNSRFLYDSVNDKIDVQSRAIAQERIRHRGRWPSSFNWEGGLNQVRQFFRDRPHGVKTFVKQQFNLPAHHLLTIRVTDTDEGYVEVNSLTINDSNWSGDYFQDVPIRVKAVAKEGYTFQHWELDNTSITEELRIDLNRATSLRPIFAISTSTQEEPTGSLAAIKDISVSPNPSSGILRLSFTAARSTHLAATLVDVQGRVIQQLFDTNFQAGTQVQILF